jgi:hypothetical protein
MTVYTSSLQSTFVNGTGGLEKVPSADKWLIDMAAATGVTVTPTANGASAPTNLGAIWLEASATAGSAGVAKSYNEVTAVWDTLTAANFLSIFGSQTDYKASVRVASTANVTLNAIGASMDGVTLAVGDLMLLKDQTTASARGLYVYKGAAVAAVRATVADTSAEVTPGMMVFVEEGTVNGQKTFKLDTTGTIVLGTTALTFSSYTPSSAVTISQGTSA